MKTRFVIAFLITLVIGAAAIGFSTLRSLNEQTPQQRPTIAPSRGYTLTWGTGTRATTTIEIAADGQGCEPLSRSDYLYRACVLATNLDPGVIAGEAFGRINLEPTAAREALIWRAVLEAAPTICEGGGLEGSPLAECRGAVDAGTRQASDAGLTVEVDHGPGA